MGLEKGLILKGNDVISMDAEHSFNQRKTSIVHDMLEAINNSFDASEDWLKQWIEDGVPCEVLQAQGGGWQIGRVRLSVSLEFIPDDPQVSTQPVEPESPLDDLRSDLDI